MNVETLAAQIIGVHLPIVRIGVDQEQGDRGAVFFQGEEISTIAAESTSTGDDAQPVDGPSFQAAIKDQLGLRLQPAKVELDVLVIDHLERPTPN